MNLTSKKARVSIGSIGVTALVAGGGWLAATSAYADPAPLTLTPGTTSIGITNLNPTTADDNAQVAYAFKVGGLGSGPLRAAVLTGPSAGSLNFLRTAGNLPPTAAGAWDTVGAPTSSAESSGAVTGYTNSDNLYVGAGTAAGGGRTALTPGTYTVALYGDTNGNGTYDAATDPAAPTMTVKVYDVNNITGPATDDLQLNVSAPETVDQGRPVKATATAPDLSTTDVRGIHAGSTVAEQGWQYQDVLRIGFAGSQVSAAAATSFGSGGWSRSIVTNAAGTLTATATIGSAMTANDTTSVVDNGVASLAWANQNTDDALFTPSVTNPNDATLRAGEKTANYRVRALDNDSTPKPVNGAWVWFTIDVNPAPDIQLSDLSASATLVKLDEDTAEVGVKTDAAGYASLAVNSNVTTDGKSYDISATSNLEDPTPSGLTATYEAAEPTTIRSVGNISSEIGDDVTVSGEVLDQWKVLYTPTMPGTQATLAVDRDFAGGPRTATAGADYSEVVNISGGKFSAVVDDPAANTAPVIDRFTWTVTGLAPVGPFEIRWIRSTVPTSVTGASLDGVTNFPISADNPLDVAEYKNNNANEVPLLAVVRDQGGDPLPYATFTVSGTDGVKFLDMDGNAQSSLTLRTNSAGQISEDETSNGLDAFFTKSGPATITVKSGSAPAVTIGFTVDLPPASEDYRVDLFDAAGEPGENVTVAAGVYDAFGNPVPGVGVDLSLPNAEFGQLSNTFPISNNSGRATTIFTSGQQDSGNVPVRAEINGGVTPPTADDDALGVGLAVPAGVNVDTNNIVVGKFKVTLSVTPSRVGPGTVELSGTATAGSKVDIYAKRTGTTSAFRVVKTVTADAEGEFGTSLSIVRSNTLYAQMATTQSPQVTSTVFSSVNFSAKALGNGKVELRADGNPNQATRMSFYTVGAGGKLSKIQTVTTNSKGFGSYIWTTSKGEKTVRAYYVATGTRSAFGQAQIVVK